MPDLPDSIDSLFNLEANYRFHQNIWNQYPLEDDTPIPPMSEFENIFESQLDDIRRSTDKWGLIFRIHHPQKDVPDALQIVKWIRKDRFNNKIENMSFEDFLGEIHKQYFQTYLHHGHAGYRTVNRIVKENKQHILPTHYQIKLLIRRNLNKGRGLYYFTYQSAFVFQAYLSGMIATHFNVYSPMGPIYNDSNLNNLGNYPGLFPQILHFGNNQPNEEYRQIFKEEFREAFLETCTEQEKVLFIESAKKNPLSRQEIADKLNISVDFLNRNIVHKFLKKVKGEFPLIPFQSFGQYSSFVEYFKGYDPFA